MTDAALISARVRSQFEFGSVWQDRDSISNYDGVVRAIIDSGPERPVYVEAVAACLTADNVVVRTGAIATLSYVGKEIGAERLQRILRENLALFRNVAPAEYLGSLDLEEALERAIAAC